MINFFTQLSYCRTSLKLIRDKPVTPYQFIPDELIVHDSQKRYYTDLTQKTISPALFP
jgi:hypothetical protein